MSQSQSQSPPQSLTTHLLSLHPSLFTKATQTPFLVRAGKGTLPKTILQEWLAQDKLYARAYVGFAEGVVGSEVDVSEGGLRKRVRDLVSEAGENVKLELKFFDDVAERYGLEISAKEGVVSEGVRRYRQLFEDVGNKVRSRNDGILEGLVLLWGTERCYLDAWRFAHSQTPSTPQDADGGALRKEFIPNWTSDAFAAFVGRIQDLTEDIWREELARDEVDVNGSLARVEALWEELLEIEHVFWPVVEEM